MIHIEFFFAPSMQESLRPPKNIIFWIRQLKQYILGTDQRKDDHSVPFPQYKALVLLHKFETS